jgi:hypothetical protein
MEFHSNSHNETIVQTGEIRARKDIRLLTATFEQVLLV